MLLPEAINVFEENLDPQTLITGLEYLLWAQIDMQNDVLFLDEVQECPRALTAAKAFCEQSPELAVIYAGSYVGLMQDVFSYPVGKLSYLDMGPLMFTEFLQAVDARLYNIYKEIDMHTMKTIPTLFHERLLQTYYLYLTVGGMPEVVQTYLTLWAKPTHTTLTQIRTLQLQLLDNYKGDFSKHAWRQQASHLLHVYESIASQLDKTQDETVDKFAFSGVIPRQHGYNKIIWPLTRLTKSRLVIRNFITWHVSVPIKAHEKKNKFKLFFHDIWLLHAALEIPPAAPLQDQALWYYKGYIMENAMAIALYEHAHTNLHSYRKNTTEIEFLFQHHTHGIIPLEVKSSTKSRRSKSLTHYIKRHAPTKAYKISAQNYGDNAEKWYETIPLYLIDKLLTYLK